MEPSWRHRRPGIGSESRIRSHIECTLGSSTKGIARGIDAFQRRKRSCMTRWPKDARARPLQIRCHRRFRIRPTWVKGAGSRPSRNGRCAVTKSRLGSCHLAAAQFPVLLVEVSSGLNSPHHLRWVGLRNCGALKVGKTEDGSLATTGGVGHGKGELMRSAENRVILPIVLAF